MKWITWMMKLAVSTVITSLCCVAMTFFAVNTYVDMLLDQYHIERPASQQLSWNQFAGRFMSQFSAFAGQDGAALGKTAEKPKDLAVSAGTSGSGNPSSTSETGSKQSKDGDNPTSKGAEGERKPPEDAVAVWSRQSTGQGSAADEERRVVVSAEEFTKKKNELSETDKAKVFSVLANRVPAEEIQKISLILEDGITGGELKELEQLLQKRLKPEEYSELQKLILTP
ncbi:hypothetical protein ACFQI7_32225 [Paenibacillus allorhizosphaerae]|nr:hypothetical protein [Paenibacillus allorhizosphaerae]